MTFKPIVLGFSLIAFAGALQAQQQPQQKQQRQQGQAQTQQQQKQQPGEMRLSNLKDMEAVNAQNQEIGQIGDVVIDLNQGRVHAVVLERGGVLGVGQENYAFAPDAIKPGKQANQVVIDVDKQKLESRQGFARNQWPGMDSDYWGRVGGKSQAAAGSGGQGKMNLVRGSELLDKQVQDKSGQQVGNVQDVIVGLDKGEVRNIVVSLQDGGRAQVPAKSIKMSGTEDRLVLDMDARQLRSQAGGTGNTGRGAARGGTGMGGMTTDRGNAPGGTGTAR
jgi:sporulation protein YlmC with PRC-barrel domain